MPTSARGAYGDVVLKPTFAPDLRSTHSYVVTAEMKPGHLDVVTLSTPDMIRQVEGVCARLLQEHLEPGFVTVGTHVCMSHSGAAMEGEEVRVEVRVKEIVKRRVIFEEECFSPRGSISTGTHERAIVSADRFG